MELPAANEHYKDVEYWNKRYMTEDTYEWFKGYQSFCNILRQKIQTNEKILILGCGNSPLSEAMYRDGYTSITNIDYSPVVIDKMKFKHSDLKMEWLVMDATNLNFPAGHFDVVLEKGTLDAMMVEEKNPWSISESTKKLVDDVLTETSRVLNEKGKFISITFAQPHFRWPLYAQTRFGWSVEEEVFGESFHYFLYTMRKGCPLIGGDRFVHATRESDDSSRAELDSDKEDYLLAICNDGGDESDEPSM